MAHPITLHTPTPEEAPLQDKLNEALVRNLTARSEGVGSGASFLIALPFGAPTA